MTRTREAPRLDLDAVALDPRTRIVVCCGSGGVGKTTTAAAIALRAAEQGRKVVVLTIDPARRLAQSMGLSELDNVPREVSGVDTAKGGELHAMMLDMKRTFDEIVSAHSTPDRAEQILANPFYQSLSSSFAGTQEYMAMEKLSQLRARDEWELIVVDTPPSRSALDFLDAPQRLGRFLDGRMLRLLLAPARAGGRAYLKVVGASFALFSRVLTRIIGTEVLRDLSAFVGALETMFGGFRERAQKTYELLQTPGTAFVVVAAPEPDALREASYFVDRLSAESMPLAGLVLNRVRSTALPRLSAERADVAADALAEAGTHQLTEAVLRVHADRFVLAARDRRMRDRFTGAHPEVPQAEVPALADRRARPGRPALGRPGPRRRLSGPGRRAGRAAVRRARVNRPEPGEPARWPDAAARSGPPNVRLSRSSGSAGPIEPAAAARRPPARAVATGRSGRQTASCSCRCSRRAVSSSVRQDGTFGRRLSSARRSRSVIPPHTPNSTWLSSASARHSVRTGHPMHTALALFCAAPCTNRSSGSLARHRAFLDQSTDHSAIIRSSPRSSAPHQNAVPHRRKLDTTCNRPRSDH